MCFDLLLLCLQFWQILPFVGPWNNLTMDVFWFGIVTSKGLSNFMVICPLKQFEPCEFWFCKYVSSIFQGDVIEVLLKSNNSLELLMW
jgi:hypothetical protein